MANRVPTLLATAVAAACSLSAHANGPTPADFAKVVLYADVTIAQDSASQWGIWEQLEPTAAGPQTPLPLLPSGGELYRPLGTVTPAAPTTATACVSGALCGFGVMSLSTYSWDQREELAIREEVFFEESNELRVGFQLFPTTSNTPSWLPESMTVSTQPIRPDAPETVPGLSLPGPLAFDGFNSHNRDNPPPQDAPAGTVVTGDRASIESDLDSAPSGSQAARFQGGLIIARYVSGGADSRPQSGTEQYGEWYGVWGLTTSAADMNNLRLSNAEAQYNGYTFNGWGGGTGSVHMSVNFGNSTFKADFNGGSGGSNPLMGGSLQQTRSGSYQVTGALSFSASGNINGSQFSANNLSIGGAYKTIDGKVEGAFFGPNAAVAGGVADVSAVVSTPGMTSPVYARYAAPFIAVKGEPKGVIGIEK